MKTKKRKRPVSAAGAQRPQEPRRLEKTFSLKLWHVLAGAAAALIAVFWVYQPALNGPFVFDDQYLPFYSYNLGRRSIFAAFRGVRPLLMASFWVNHRFSRLDPYGYHFLNILLHFVNSLLVFFILRKLLEWAGTESPRREILAGFGASVFLLHPVETESVAYVASRSESLSVLFFYAAFALFLYRKSAAVSWRVALGVVLLFGAAASTKEHTVALPALLLLTDYFWNPGFSLQGIRRNWRLYAPLAIAGAAGLYFVWRVIRTSASAGFSMRELTWDQYFFTQCRAVWVYLRLYVLPFGQNVDYAYPISRTIFEGGAIVGLIGLVTLVACAVYFRRRYPLASYGLLTTLILLAPTSSFIPIKDAVAERRLYMPMIGLLLVTVDLLRRWRASRTLMGAAFAAVLLIGGVLTYQRSKLWSSEIALWEDSLAKSPHNARAHLHLAVAYYEQRQCEVAEKYYESAARLTRMEYRELLNWALTKDCLNRPEDALAKLQQAAKLRETAHVYSQIGMIYAKQHQFDEAFGALNKAIQINPRFDMSYVYRGNIYALSNNLAGALAEYRHALQLNPNNQSARNNLRKAEARMRAGQ